MEWEGASGLSGSFTGSPPPLFAAQRAMVSDCRGGVAVSDRDEAVR